MTIKRKSTSSALITTSSGTGTSASKRVKVSSSPDQGGERDRPMTEKEKRKAARMVRNRLSAQNSRDKKRLHLESLESTIHHLQAENKDLMARLVRATGETNLGVGVGVGAGMGMGRLPLSPGPSSLKEQAGETEGESEGEEDEDEDEDEEMDDEQEEEVFTPASSASAHPPARRSSTQPPNPSSSQPQPTQPYNPPTSQPSTSPSAFNQTLVNLTTENVTLKERVKKLDSVIQVLLAGTSGMGMGFNVVPSSSVQAPATGPVEQIAVNPMSLLSPSSRSSPPQLYHQPLASTFTTTSTFNSFPVSTSVSTATPAPTFTPNNTDRACQPAALAITSTPATTSSQEVEAENEVTLQRARFFPSLKPRKGSGRGRVNKDKEEQEQRWRMEVGLERVLGWRRGVEG